MSDTLTVSIRIHDPLERQDEKKATRWSVFEVPRADLELPDADFIAKWIAPAATFIKKIGQ